MKIIEALNKVKDLDTKVKDLTYKIGCCCADTELDTPLYPDQKGKISEWLQGVHDITLEIETLKHRIQKTNVMTEVPIELNGKIITKSITRWIIRRRDLAGKDLSAWMQLSDRGLRAQSSQSSNSNETKIYKVRRYFDPAEKDKMTGLYSSEPSIIDGKLEIINAITELLE